MNIKIIIYIDTLFRHIHVLRWIYNQIWCIIVTSHERDGVLDHHTLDCLFNNLFWLAPRKSQKLHVAGPFTGILRWPVYSYKKTTYGIMKNGLIEECVNRTIFERCQFVLFELIMTQLISI